MNFLQNVLACVFIAIATGIGVYIVGCLQTGMIDSFSWGVGVKNSLSSLWLCMTCILCVLLVRK